MGPDWRSGRERELGGGSSQACVRTPASAAAAARRLMYRRTATTSRPTNSRPSTTSTAIMATCQTGIDCSGSPFSYTQLFTAVYRMLCAARRISMTEVAERSSTWLVVSVVESMASVPARIAC